MIGDAIRAARLDPDLYNAIEHDRSYTVRAMVLVVVVSPVALTCVGGLPCSTPSSFLHR